MSLNVRTSYLRFPLELDDRHVRIYDPERPTRLLGVVRSIKQARLFVRGYRRAS